MNMGDTLHRKLSLCLVFCLFGLCIQCIVYVIVYPENNYVISIVQASRELLGGVSAPAESFQSPFSSTLNDASLSVKLAVQDVLKPGYVSVEAQHTLYEPLINLTNTLDVHSHSVTSSDLIIIPDERNVAIGCAIKWNKRKSNSWINFVNIHPLFRYFLPSFCRTSTAEYHYHFYLTHDYDDELLSYEEGQNVMIRRFKELIKKQCNSKVNVSLNIIKLDYKGKPAWAQNDAMMAAYLDNMPYYYRVNDDTVFKTKNWTPTLIGALNKFVPHNVGVVGPTHRGGNIGILTYDFVNIKHLDIFGFYYPRAFPDWFADDWITKVYKATSHMKKIGDVKIVHMLTGGRYIWHPDKKKLLKDEIANGQAILKKWIDVQNKQQNKEIKELKIVSYNLATDDINKILGLIRNAQLMAVYYPDWKMRIYAENPKCNKYPSVHYKYINKLRLLGCEVVYINTDVITIAPMLWKYFVMDDPTVSRYIIRLANSRISEREQRLVELWEKSNHRYHVIRDHPSHSNQIIVDGLFGGVGLAVSPRTQAPFGAWSASMVDKDSFEPLTHRQFLNRRLSPVIKVDLLCHDSVSCKQWENCTGIARRKNPQDYVGQKYDAYHVPIKKEIILSDKKCIL